MTRLLNALSKFGPDALAIAGLGLVAFGLAQAPAPWGMILGPIALGLGLIAAVRFGSR
jgi:hypothetical protein